MHNTAQTKRQLTLAETAMILMTYTRNISLALSNQRVVFPKVTHIRPANEMYKRDPEETEDTKEKRCKGRFRRSPDRREEPSQAFHETRMILQIQT